MWLSRLVDRASAHMLRELKKYQKRFNNIVRSIRDSLQVGSFVFLRREHVLRDRATHNLTPIADGPYEVPYRNETTVAIKIGAHIDRISCKRVVTSPISDTGTPYIVNDTASHHGHYDPPSPAAGSDTTRAEPSRVLSLEYIIWRNLT